MYGGYSGEGGSANGTNITLIGDGNNINIAGVISGGNRGTDDCSLLGTKTLNIGTSEQGFVAADSQAFTIQDIEVVKVSKDSQVAFANDFSIDKLIIELGEAAMSGNQFQVSITDGATFNTLTLVSSTDFSSDESNTLDLNSVFGDNASYVLASMQEHNTNLTVVDSSNQEWTTKNLNYGDDGTVSFNLGSQVPEPSVYAAVFGALAFGAAVFSRRR